jgi:hypothetical protein
LVCVIGAKSRISFPFNIERAGKNHFKKPYATDELPDIFNTIKVVHVSLLSSKKEKVTGK